MMNTHTRFLLPLALVLGALNWSLSSAKAIPPFQKEFLAKYVTPNADKAKALAAAKCDVCHVKGQKKNVRNTYGIELSKLLDKKADAKNAKKIQESLDKVAALKSDPKNDKSPTFGALLAEGKLPGTVAAPAAKPKPAAKPMPKPMPKPEEKPAPPAKPRPKPMPEKRPADPANAEAAIKGVNELGGTVRDIAMNDDSKDVDFHLSGTALGDHGLVYVKAIPKIVILHLKDTQVSDAGLKDLAGLKTLKKLHLEKTLITDAGLAHLKGLENLEYLNVYGTAVTDAGLEHLKGLKNLKKVYVWQTKVTDEGAKKLQEAMPNLKVIK